MAAALSIIAGTAFAASLSGTNAGSPSASTAFGDIALPLAKLGPVRRAVSLVSVSDNGPCIGRQGRRMPSWLTGAVAVSSPEADADEVEEEVEEEGDSPLTPNAFEIQSLLMELCDETNVAELKLKVGSFKLHVKRDVGKLKGGVPFTAPPVPSRPMEEAAPATVIAAVAQKGYETEDEDIDEGLLYDKADKVGVFRRGKMYKGKQGRPIVTEGATVKKGQVLGYLEQLGTYSPVESEHGGEVVKFLVEEGEAVGYGDTIVALRPSFAGIKKGAGLV
eukprot:TRINITY_DN7510_c0_g1_i1.p1 TRINITY_DN7510_c0_g1~~TRINITY_DN7510_c0_g1_i1.p1  ORF type:complete len:277 (+),score=82.72 TRINITY_DN7510_c0_g1_i1:103-933(+)